MPAADTVSPAARHTRDERCMTETSLISLTATEAVAKLRAREITPLDLIDAAAARIAEVEPAVNALPAHAEASVHRGDAPIEPTTAAPMRSAPPTTQVSRRERRRSCWLRMVLKLFQ